MSDSGSRPSDDLDPQQQDAFRTLRNLLLEPERTHLEQLEQKIDSATLTARNVSHVLPEAIVLRGEGDRQLTTALAPHVSSALTATVRKKPHMIVDAISPIMGPAIRQAIANALRGMVQSLNQTLEHTMTFRGLQWRLEAFRSGRPFGEVVLLHTLLYRVEQVFLIHKDTGLLLSHAAAESTAVQDQSLVSGMLTAIRAFVQDSFGSRPSDALDRFQVGDLTVWIEQGPRAILAAVIRGTPPETLHRLFQSTLERIHQDYHQGLVDFEGDASAFSTSQAVLEDCLHAQFETPTRRTSPATWLLALAILVGLSWWGSSAYRDHQRWTAFLGRVRVEPGFVVTAADTVGGEYRIDGLRDPLATDPELILKAFQLDQDRVRTNWKPYYAIDPELVERRALALLTPPNSLRLSMKGSTLTATGSASIEWLLKTRVRALMIPGITRYVDAEPVDHLFEELRKAIKSRRILFSTGRSRLEPNQRDEVAAVAAVLDRLNHLTEWSGKQATVSIIGQTDPTGSETTNRRLSEARAEAVAGALKSTRFSAIRFTTVGVGASEADRQGGADIDAAHDRRVTFDITVEDPH